MLTLLCIVSIQFFSHFLWQIDEENLLYSHVLHNIYQTDQRQSLVHANVTMHSLHTIFLHFLWQIDEENLLYSHVLHNIYQTDQRQSLVHANVTMHSLHTIFLHFLWQIDEENLLYSHVLLQLMITSIILMQGETRCKSL